MGGNLNILLRIVQSEGWREAESKLCEYRLIISNRNVRSPAALQCKAILFCDCDNLTKQLHDHDKYRALDIIKQMRKRLDEVQEEAHELDYLHTMLS